MRSLWLMMIGATLAVQLVAQEFHPPSVQPARPHGTRLGLFGFGVRSGVDFKGNGELVLGVALDAGNLFVNRLRLRPSAELSVLSGTDTYVGSLEVLYHFADDDQAAVPYAGTGLAVAGHANCATDANCPGLWLNVVVGIEVRFRSTFNWLLEYHALDAFQRSRLYLGLTTRRGS
jgi:hypothetical protein